MYYICWLYMNRFLGLSICKGCIPVVCQYIIACRKTSWTACNGECHRRGNSERRKKGGRGMSPFFLYKKNTLICTFPVLTWNMRQMYVQINCHCALLKVCHSSAIQTISVRSVYIINHSGSVLHVAKNLFHISKMYATIN